MHKWTEDRWHGVLLITAVVIGLFVMAHHPTTHLILGAADPPGAVRLNRLLHAVAIVAMPVQFIGLLGLTRRLGPTLCSQAALVTQGFGLVAGMGAAVASGFVASGVMLDMVREGQSPQASAILGYTGLWNQGFAAIYVVGTGASVLLWSIAILSGSAMPRALGWLGVIVGGAVTLWQLVGSHHLGVHEFGLVVLAEAVWMIWVGILLSRQRSQP